MALINSKCNCLMPLHFKGLRQYVVIQICMWLSLSADLSLNLNFNQKTLHFSEVQFTTLDRVLWPWILFWCCLRTVDDFIFRV